MKKLTFIFGVFALSGVFVTTVLYEVSVYRTSHRIESTEMCIPFVGGNESRNGDVLTQDGKGHLQWCNLAKLEGK